MDSSSPLSFERRPWRHDAPGAAAFASAYLDNYDEIAQALERVIVDHPVFGPLASSISPADRAREDAAARERLEAAFRGDWEAYASNLRQQGESYAAMGIRFADWYDLVGAFTSVLTRILVGESWRSPDALANALLSMREFLDRALSILGQSYVDASEARLRRRQAELERWAAIFRHVAWGVMITRGDGRVEVANPALAAMCGRDPSVMGGALVEELFASGEAERVRATVGGQALRDGATTYETIFARPDGTTFPARVEAARVSSPGEDER